MARNMVGTSIFLCILSLLIFAFGCGGKGASTTLGNLPPPPDINLEMPSGWTDSILEKVKKEEPLTTVLAVTKIMDTEAKKPDEVIRKTLTTALTNTGKFTLVERALVDSVFEEAALLEALGSTQMNAQEIADVGKNALGAEVLVVGGTSGGIADGTIDKFTHQERTLDIDIDIRAVDTKTFEICFAQHAHGQAHGVIAVDGEGKSVAGDKNSKSLYAKAARQATEEVAGKIGSLYPLLGYVASVQGDKVTTDVGSSRGAKTGDIFIVFRKGDEILHPETQKHLGWSKTVLAAIQIISTEEKMSTGNVFKISTPETNIIPSDLVIALEVPRKR